MFVQFPGIRLTNVNPSGSVEVSSRLSMGEKAWLRGWRGWCYTPPGGPLTVDPGVEPKIMGKPPNNPFNRVFPL